MKLSAISFALACSAVGLALSGCGGALSTGLPAGRSFTSAEALQRRSSATSPIQHVVLMIQENRSFDDFFATFPGADGATRGLMKTAHGDVYVPLKKADYDSDSLGHEHSAFEKEYDGGKMDGFNLVTRAIHHGVQVTAGKYSYRYVDPTQISPYWFIAEHYILADHMFTTQSSSSFTAHQDFIAGGTPVDGDNVIDFPDPSAWGCDAKPGTVTNLITSAGKYLYAKGPFPCFGYETLADLLDAHDVSWLYFTNKTGGYVWNAFDAINAVRYGSEWTQNIVIPENKVFDNISQGTLPAVSWVIPDGLTSDHPGIHSNRGPSWVSNVINSIGESAYWPSTAIIVVWDEWGGEYDNVPPPQLDGQGLGMRVPMLIVSAYDRKSQGHAGYIAHTQYEDGSILKFIEQNWNLGSLGTSDVRAHSIVNCFNFTRPPRAFIKIPTTYPMAYFKNMRPSDVPVDEY